ncbi:hypothetical protein [Loktanella sp. SALINAS62]|uniref:hypothetical protein n=1 Tax=Loktanella sp. SALINAS62 TaxID=2706124 RepID=UPI001B8D0956|nr:hypothetical protein [Loktanella sp. SALINAS62]MBS1303122.1 glycoside hydrolase family 104 protein [Loktanella sp. SALINAS62]
MILKHLFAAVLSATVTLVILWPEQPKADTQPAAFLQKRGPLIVSREPTPRPAALTRTPSLFAGQAGNSLFAPAAPRPAENDRRRVAAVSPLIVPDQRIMLRGQAGARDVQVLRQVIGYAESRRDGYDAVVYGARVMPPARPTQMTVGDIFAWIDATPRQNHAIGRYQFIPSTLRRLVRVTGTSERDLFSPALQDRLADVLLAEAGLDDVRAGDMGRHRFMNNLARIWAGLPNSTGKSHYHGYAGNKSSISWAQFDAELQQVFPNRG